MKRFKKRKSLNSTKGQLLVVKQQSNKVNKSAPKKSHGQSVHMVHANIEIDLRSSGVTDTAVIQRASMILANYLFGSKKIVKSPYKHFNFEALMRKIIQRLILRFGEDSAIVQFEKENLEKIGPRSISIPWNDGRKESLLSYFNPTLPTLKTEDKLRLSDSKHLVSGRNLFRKLRPLSTYQEAYECLNMSKNAGFPTLTTKGESYEEALKEIQANTWESSIFMLWTRTQEESKTRNTFGAPLSSAILEYQYFKPFFEVLRNNYSCFSAMSTPELVDEQMSKILSFMLTGNRNLTHTMVSIDFSNFDTSLTKDITQCVDIFIKHHFQRKCHEDWDRLSNYFQHAGVVTPDGVKRGEHSLFSGRVFTNAIGSIAQYLVANHSGVLIDGMYQILGDDGIYVVKDTDAFTLKETFKRFGFEVNEAKTRISKTDCTFLRKLYLTKEPANGGIYSIVRGLNHIRYPERFLIYSGEISVKRANMVRDIMIMENSKCHPEFEYYVRQFSRASKYGWSVNDLDVKQYMHFLDSKGMDSNSTKKYSIERGGIACFEAFKILKEMETVNNYIVYKD